jgi:hypothetical protein
MYELRYLLLKIVLIQCSLSTFFAGASNLRRSNTDMCDLWHVNDGLCLTLWTTLRLLACPKADTSYVLILPSGVPEVSHIMFWLLPHFSYIF